MGQITELSKDINGNAINKGFYLVGYDFNDPIWIGCRLMLIVSEIAEGLEGIRKVENKQVAYSIEPKSGGLGEELADATIRIFDLAYSLGIDIEKAIIEKHEYNKSRPYRHGGKRI